MKKSRSAVLATPDAEFLARSACLAMWLAVVALGAGCGGGEEEAAAVVSAPAPPPCQIATPTAGAVTLSGTATFMSVPNNPVTGALNYAAARPKPIRGVTAELLNAAGASLGSCVTSNSGAYAFSVTGFPGDVRVRVRAEMRKTSEGGGQWDFKVEDNTSADALYVLDSPAVTPKLGEVVQRDVLADSGFDGARYSGARAAGPFAILDVVFQATQKVLSVAPDQVFPPLRLFWSVKNLPADGDLSLGEIGTSFYFFDGQEELPENQHKLFLLGQEDVDTDEYDTHVVAHEWGHYFQTAFSRDDSVGGPHSLGDKLDMRVAFSEGWGNAWSGMALGSPLYADSGGPGQAAGSLINVSLSPGPADQGWFSEASIQFLMWNFHEAETVGFAPIFNVMTGPLKDSELFTAIHNFATLLKAAAPAGASAINNLLQGQQISTQDDPLGGAETNDGGIAEALPIYRPASGVHCVTDKAGLFNKLANFSFIRFQTTAGEHVVTVNSVAGQTGSDPDFAITQSDGFREFAQGFNRDTETLKVFLPAGTHTLELQDFSLLAEEVKGQRCFNLIVQ